MNEFIILSVFFIKIIIFCGFFPMFLKYAILFYKEMSSIPYNFENNLEKQRLLFFIYGLIFSITSIKLINIKENNNLDLFYNIGGLSMALISIYLFIFIWTNKFKVMFNQSKEQKLFNGLKSPLYNSRLDLDEILKKIPEFECKPEVFKNLLLGNIISEKDKIISSYSKAKLIRFLIIIFGISNDSSFHKKIKTIVSHYFIQKKHQAPYIFKSPSSAISDGFSEKINMSDSYSKELSNINNIFSVK